MCMVPAYSRQVNWPHAAQVVLLGKPASAIYEVAMEMLEVTDPKQVLAIGDSAEHDIAGKQVGSACAHDIGHKPMTRLPLRVRP